MEVEWSRCSALYYLRGKYYGKAKKVAKDALSQHPDLNEFLFYHGLANILEGQVQKGINDLMSLQSDKDLQLAVFMALIYSYKLINSHDKEDLYNIETKLKEERKQAGATSFYYAGLFLSLAEKYEKAVEHINKSQRKDSNNINTVILKGWNDMLSNTSNLKNSTLDCFELAVQKNDKNIEALLGIAKFKHLVGDFEGSNLVLDKLIVHNPREIIPLMEKLKNEFATLKWEAVYDAIERIFSIDENNIDALKIKIFIALCKNCDYIEAVDQLDRFFSILESDESTNGYQFLDTAQTFSKACGRNNAVLSQVYRFVQYASEMYPNNVEYLCEVGYQCVLQGKHKDALNFFKAASKIDSNSIMSLCGLTICQMYENGPTDQVAQQVELLFEMQGNIKFPMLYLLLAQLNSKNPKAQSYLSKAIETQISMAAAYPMSLAYIKKLDPDFLLEVYKEYRKHFPKKPLVITGCLLYTQEGESTVYVSCDKILNTICKACPGLIPALYELAKLKFLFGFASEALKLCQQVCDLDNTHASSHVLLAQIYIQQQAFTKAAQSLDMCLSYNFKVRDSAMYHFLNGVILKSANQLQEALSSFNTCLQVSNKNTNKHETDLNIIDKASVYLEIIELQTTLGLLGDAGKMMQEAIQELAYTSEESRLSIARADLALKKGDIDTAIDILNEVKPGQPYYFQAHSRMAHVYLKEKKDHAMFTNCFKDIVSNHPMADAHTMMGDAFMSIHEPKQAALAYETALAGCPGDAQLVRRLGGALYAAHEYERALRHYEAAARDDDDVRAEYLELLIKLKQYDKVDSTISSELNRPHNKEKDIKTLKRRIQLLLLQAKSRDIKNPTAGNTNLLLTEAKELQSAVLKRMEIDARGDVAEEKRKLSDILCALAKVKSAKEPAVAINLYSEALIHCPREPSTLLALAKLFAQMNNPERCEQTCAVLLSADPHHEPAAVMMADLAFRKVDFESAARHLTQIVSVAPRAWAALAQLVQVQWRRAELPAAARALQAAGDENTQDEGYAYCAGLVAMYEGRVNAALRHFNRARRSAWGRAAAARMVALCLTQHDADAGDDSDTRLLALRTAEKLLAEVAPAERRALQALVALAGRQRAAAERVLQELLPLLTDDHRDDPLLILAVANAYTIVKQPTRAKNVLKRTVAAIPWSPENADGLERCWLEVVDQQVSSGRLDAAKELLSKILLHNRSCAAAYQYLGHIAEKEQNYKSAAQHYDKAWVHSGNDLAIGYRLAQAYLKVKKYPECIVVCRAILKVHPDYPKLKKEIYEKAKNNLRT